MTHCRWSQSYNIGVRVINSRNIASVFLLSLVTTVVADDKITDDDLERHFGESAPYRYVFEQVKAAVQSDDRGGLAKLVHYPIVIYREKEGCCGSEPVDIVEDSNEFARRYEEIITPDVRRMIKDQHFNDLHLSWRGLGFKLGVVWIVGYCIGPDEKDTCAETIVGVKSIQTYVAKYSKPNSE